MSYIWDLWSTLLNLLTSDDLPAFALIGIIVGATAGLVLK